MPCFYQFHDDRSSHTTRRYSGAPILHPNLNMTDEIHNIDFSSGGFGYRSGELAT
jgi:hypothetical protein